MEIGFLLLIAVVIAIIVYVRSKASSQRAECHISAPIDPRIEVVLRPRGTGRNDMNRARDEVRKYQSHILRAVQDDGETPLLVWHADDMLCSLLVITDRAMVSYRGDTVDRIAHGSARFSISRLGHDDRGMARIMIEAPGTALVVDTKSVLSARAMCSAVDALGEDPTLRGGAHVVVGHEVIVPDAFFAGILHRCGFTVDGANMRSLHERVGMMLFGRIRSIVESEFGLASGTRFAADHGRPADDAALPGWARRILAGLVALEPDMAPLGYVELMKVRKSLVELSSTGNGYLSRPGRPLSMWQSDRYEDQGSGRRRHDPDGPLVAGS